MTDIPGVTPTEREAGAAVVLPFVTAFMASPIDPLDFEIIDALIAEGWRPERPKIEIVITEPRCSACGQLGHNCPTGGRLLR